MWRKHTSSNNKKTNKTKKRKNRVHNINNKKEYLLIFSQKHEYIAMKKYDDSFHS